MTGTMRTLEFLALRKYTPEQRIRIVEQAIYNTIRETLVW